MTTFIKRTISGAVYVIVVVGAILGGPVVFGIFSILLLGLSLSEFRDVTRIGDKYIPAIPFYLINGAIMILSVLVAVEMINSRFLLMAAALVFTIFLIPALSRQVHSVNQLGDFLIAVFYITIPLAMLNFYHFFDGDSTWNVLLLSTFIILWLNDTFAYIVGSLAGRNKLSEEISPKKTWEGSIGGLIFSLGGAAVLELLLGVMDFWQWLGFALVIVVSGTFGDLFESALKRRAGLKESGDLIPGHGGILDRLDSLLLAAPFVFIYFMLVL